jgi:hypothetical protein
LHISSYLLENPRKKAEMNPSDPNIDQSAAVVVGDCKPVPLAERHEHLADEGTSAKSNDPEVATNLSPPRVKVDSSLRDSPYITVLDNDGKLVRVAREEMLRVFANPESSYPDRSSSTAGRQPNFDSDSGEDEAKMPATPKGGKSGNVSVAHHRSPKSFGVSRGINARSQLTDRDNDDAVVAIETVSDNDGGVGNSRCQRSLRLNSQPRQETRIDSKVARRSNSVSGGGDGDDGEDGGDGSDDYNPSEEGSNRFDEDDAVPQKGQPGRKSRVAFSNFYQVPSGKNICFEGLVTLIPIF